MKELLILHGKLLPLSDFYFYQQEWIWIFVKEIFYHHEGIELFIEAIKQNSYIGNLRGFLDFMSP